MDSSGKKNDIFKKVGKWYCVNLCKGLDNIIFSGMTNKDFYTFIFKGVFIKKIKYYQKF